MAFSVSHVRPSFLKIARLRVGYAGVAACLRQYCSPRLAQRVILATALLPFVVGNDALPSPRLIIKAKESSPPSVSSEEARKQKKEVRKKLLIDLVDAKTSEENHQEARQLLEDFKAEEKGDPRLLWRHSRALYELSGVSTPITTSPIAADTSPETQHQLLETALRSAARAIDATTSSETNQETSEAAAEAHMWYAIVLEALGRWKNLSEKIADAYVIKEHYLKSLQSKPQNAVVLHCLGSWCFTFASVNWFERKLAQTAFLEPPSSTYLEALGYFRAAEEVSPNFYSLNLLFIAKCYAHLKNEVKANEYLERVVNFRVAKVRSEEDASAAKEAQRILLIDDH